MKGNQNTDMTYTSHGKKKALGKLVRVGKDEKTALAYVEVNGTVYDPHSVNE